MWMFGTDGDDVVCRGSANSNSLLYINIRKLVEKSWKMNDEPCKSKTIKIIVPWNC